MRRKALSLLLAAAMVFSMNAVSFAAETTETVETQAVQKWAEDHDTISVNGVDVIITKDIIDKIAEVQKSNKAAQSANNGSFSANAFDTQATSGDLEFSGINKLSVVPATGSKIKAADIWDSNAGYNNPGFYVSANGYRVGFKSVKITGKGQKAGDVVKFKFNKILPAKNVVKVLPTGVTRTVTLSEAKKAYKGLQAAFKAVKNTEYQSVVAPRRIYNAVSIDYVKAVVKAADKKQVSWNALNGNDYQTGAFDIKKNIESAVVVTVKNGAVKKVQLPILKTVKSTSWSDGRTTEGGTKIGANTGSFFKLGYKTLKKNKDYTLSGNTVVLDPSTTYVYFDTTIANFDVTK